MNRRRFSIGAGLLAAGHVWAGHVAAAGIAERMQPRVLVLAYHRFAATVADGMTVRLDTFAAHLRLLAELECHVTSMDQFLAWQQGVHALPPRAVVLTADDAHRSQFEHMAPLLRPLKWPVTLFVYPSAVSNAPYAMTWEQLAALRDSGQFRIESHTYWHPHFPRERRQMQPDAFHDFVADQLVRSRRQLEQKLGGRVSLLAWPFGLGDADLSEQARAAGYEAAFSLGNRPVTRADDPYALPRYLVTDALGARPLRRLLEDCFA